MPFDAQPNAYNDLRLDRTMVELPADARHDYGHIGGMGPYRALTHITRNERFVATVAGHVEDGEVYVSHGKAYRLSLGGVA